MKIFDSTLIDPIFDVESIGDGPRVPRAHLEVVFTTTQRTFLPAHVRVDSPDHPFFCNRWPHPLHTFLSFLEYTPPSVMQREAMHKIKTASQTPPAKHAKHARPTADRAPIGVRL